MKAAIGLRFYKVTAHRRNAREPEPCEPSELKVPLPLFLTQFVATHTESKQDEVLERSWYFEEKEPEGPASIRGYVHYGTYGFESRFKNTKTKSATYDRKVDDVEEIPLFFEFWSPEKDNLTLVAFQSFQGRSCVSLVRTEMRHQFEALNSGFILRFEKLVGGDSPNSLFATAPVKKLSFIQHRPSSDKFTSYGSATPSGGYDFEVAFKARRGGTLGALLPVTHGLDRNEKGLIVFRGEEFDEAVATVMIGKRQRPVGIIGPTSDTGSIDVSEEIERAPNGHPTFKSIAHQASDIAVDFHNRLVGK